MDPVEVAARAKRGGHASATRAQTPSPEVVELIQAERLVECFEAELWGTVGDMQTLLETAKAGFAQSRVPVLQINIDEIDAIRSELVNLGRTWRGMQPGDSIDLLWGESAC